MQEASWVGHDPLGLDRATGREPGAGSSSGRMGLMLKAPAFMAASPVMILTEMTLSR